MKNYLVIFYACFALLLAGCAVGYIATVPDDQVVVRTEPPFVGAIWIDSEWRWDGGHYVTVPGHWEHPRASRTWRSGTWQKTNRGYRWQGGSWHR